MSRKTQGVYDLVADILDTIPQPYTIDVIEDVFFAIPGRDEWIEIYNALVGELGEHVVNAWAGRYTKEITGRQSGSQVRATRSLLIESYTKLLP